MVPPAFVVGTEAALVVGTGALVVGTAALVVAAAAVVEAPTVGRLFPAVVCWGAEVAVGKAATVVLTAGVVAAGLFTAAVVPVPAVALTAAWGVPVVVGFEPLLPRTRNATTPTMTRASMPTPTRIKGVFERGGFAGGTGPPLP